jgi:hypothetical protein
VIPDSMPQVLRATTRLFSPLAISAMLLMGMTVYAFENRMTNYGFHNYSSREFDAAELHVLGQGLQFVPTPRARDPSLTWRGDFNRFERSVYLGDYFFQQNDHPPADSDQACPTSFRIPKPDWHPRTDADGYVPSEGVPEYAEAVLSEMNHRADNVFPKRLPNMKRAHVDAVKRLQEDPDITITNTDKNPPSGIPLTGTMAGRWGPRTTDLSLAPPQGERGVLRMR